MENGDTTGIEGKKLVEDICAIAWTRLPGSEEERRAQAFIQEKMKESGAESIDVHQYSVHSAFFRWWPVVSIILFYISLFCYNVFPLLSMIAGAIALLNVLFKLFSYEFLDVLFKNKTSTNVIGKLPTRTSIAPKRVLIIGGHADSNYEYPIGSRFGTKLIPLLIPVFATMAVGVLVSMIKFFTAWIDANFLFGIGPNAWLAFTAPDWLDIIYFVVLAMLPYASWIGFDMISSNPVPGANDNLSGIAVILLLLKHFANSDERPSNIELWFVSFGCEEGGMKGSKYMARKLRDAIDDGQMGASSAWVVNFDSIASKGPMLVATKEPMYRCTYLPEVYTQIAASAKAAGVDVVVKSLAAGTDSSPFGRLGIPATGIVGIGEGYSPANWHSLDDTPDNIDETGIEHCVNLSIQFIHDVDQSLNEGN